MTKPNAIFIGTHRSLKEPVFHEASARLEMTPHPQWGSGIDAVEASAPWLVLVTGTPDNPDPRGFFESLRARLPHCVAPVLAIEVLARRLTLQRHGQEEGARRVEVHALEELSEVLTGLLEPAVAPRELASLADEGYYNHVPVGDRTLHVQTEVLPRGRYRIKSTVYEGGTVLYGTSQILPLDVSSIEQGQAQVRAQHDVVMDLVRRRSW